MAGSTSASSAPGISRSSPWFPMYVRESRPTIARASAARLPETQPTSA